MILSPAAPASPYGPANLGQLKHVARQAKKHLDATLPGGAGPALSTLTAGFADDPASNFSPINLGQLKAVAKPFYDRLLTAGYDTRQSLIDHGYPTSWTFDYPWDPATPASANYAPANLGQLKLVFSFDLSGFSPTGDSDSDGLPDAWEIQYFGTITAYGDTDDPDGDGATNREEHQSGRTPVAKDNPAVGLLIFHPNEYR